MANIPVAPFYVPRPAQEQLWSSGPLSNRGIIDLCTTQLKFNGAPGQVPTKKWGPIYTWDDPSVWNSAPIDSPIIPFSTRPKMFGQGGQVPAKNWGPPYTFDDPSVWNIPSKNSEAIPLLTKQKIFGQGGQTVTKHWEQADFGEAHWNAKPIPSKYLVAASPFLFNNFNGSDDPSIWLAQSDPSAAISLLIKQKLFGQGGQVPVKQWNVSYTFDDTAIWQQPSQRSLPLSFFPFETQIRWSSRSGIDDPVWYSQIIDVPQTLSVVTTVPFVAQQASSNVPTDQPWLWNWYDANQCLQIVQAVNYSKMSFYVLQSEDSAAWLLTKQRDLSLNTVFNYAFVAQQANFDVPADQYWRNWYDLNQSLYLVQIPSNNPSRAPFYVPRPGDQPDWQGKPVRWTIDLTLVPYETGNEYFSYRDLQEEPYWQGKPTEWMIDLNLIPYETGNEYFSYRDLQEEPIWQGKPFSGVHIPPTGKPFISKFYKFNIDYSEFWKQPTKQNLSMATVPGITPYKIRQPSFAYDDYAVWYACSVNSTVIPFVTASGATKAKQWHYDNDDFSSWSFPWNNYNQVNATATKARPFNAVYWNFNNDDPALSWQQPVQRNTVLPLVPNIKVVYWNFNNDDSPPWQQPSQRFDLFMLAPSIKVVYWKFNNDDPPPWKQPSQRNTLFPFVPFIQNRWRFNQIADQFWSFTAHWNLLDALSYNISANNYWRMNISEDDSSAPWSMMEISQAGNILPLIPLPFVIGFNQPFVYNDPPVWSGNPIDSDIIPDLTISGQVQSHQWLFGYDNPTVWTGQPISNTTIVGQITSHQWLFGYNDPAVWSGRPIASRPLIPITASGQVQSRQWLFGYDDTGIWSGSPVSNTIIVGQINSHQWLFGYSDPAVWSGNPVSSNTISYLTVGGIIKAKQWHYDNDDFSAWFPWANRNLIEISLKPSIAVYWKFNNDDAAPSWQQPVQKSQPTVTFKYPAIIRQPSFAYDDYSSYQWPMKSEIILSLTWNILIERIAKTTTENRIINASAKSQITNVLVENRIVDAPDEDDDS